MASKASDRPIVQVYDKRTGVYVSTRKDGSVTVGRFNERGSNFRLDHKG